MAGDYIWHVNDQSSGEAGVCITLAYSDKCCDTNYIDVDRDISEAEAQQLCWDSIGHLKTVSGQGGNWNADDPGSQVGVFVRLARWMFECDSSYALDCVVGSDSDDYFISDDCSSEGTYPSTSCPVIPIESRILEFSSIGQLETVMECGRRVWRRNQPDGLGCLVEVSRVLRGDGLECDPDASFFAVTRIVLEFDSVGHLVAIRHVENCPYTYRGFTCQGEQLPRCPKGWVTTTCCAVEAGILDCSPQLDCEAYCAPRRFCVEMTLFQDPNITENCPITENAVLEYNDSSKMWEGEVTFEGCLDSASATDCDTRDCVVTLKFFCAGDIGVLEREFCECNPGTPAFRMTFSGPCLTPSSGTTLDLVAVGQCCNNIIATYEGSASDIGIECCYELGSVLSSDSASQSCSPANYDFSVTVYDPNLQNPLDCDCESGPPES